MDAFGRVVNDLLQTVSNDRPYKDHQSDLDDGSAAAAVGNLPLVYNDEEEASSAIAVAHSAALSESDWISSMDEKLFDSEFAEDLFTDAKTVDSYAMDPSYPTTGPPSALRHQYDYQMEIMLPPEVTTAIDAFTVRVPAFEDFAGRSVIMTGCALDPDGMGCLFTNTTVPLAVGFSTAHSTCEALVRARPDDIAPIAGTIAYAGEVVNGVLLSTPSVFLGSMLSTGNQIELRGETRGLAPPPPAPAENSEAECAAAAAAMPAPVPEPSPDDRVYMARDMQTFALLLDYAQTGELTREELEDVRRVLFLHHGSEYVITRKQFDVIATHAQRRWKRQEPQEFFLTVRRVDGRFWYPDDHDWKVSLSVLFEFCCANH